MVKKNSCRKILCSVYSEEVRRIMELMKTQSKATIGKWSLAYAEGVILPIYLKYYPNDARPLAAIAAARDWFDKKVKLPVVKNFIYDCHSAAKEAEENPAAQSAARAIAHAASTAHTPLHGLGIVLYGATALAYERAGTQEKKELYDLITSEECLKMEEALKTLAVADEPNPINVDWAVMSSEKSLFNRSYLGKKTKP